MNGSTKHLLWIIAALLAFHLLIAVTLLVGVQRFHFFAFPEKSLLAPKSSASPASSPSSRLSGAALFPASAGVSQVVVGSHLRAPSEVSARGVNFSKART